MSDFIDHERPYPWPTDAAHAVPAMLCLEYKDKPRQRKWRVEAQRAHLEAHPQVIDNSSMLGAR